MITAGRSGRIGFGGTAPIVGSGCGPLAQGGALGRTGGATFPTGLGSARLGLRGHCGSAVAGLRRVGLPFAALATAAFVGGE